MSGSDCGNIFMWDKNSESIVQWLPGDKTGVVNCLEGHPEFPILATSGLDRNVKVWAPTHRDDVVMTKTNSIFILTCDLLLFFFIFCRDHKKLN